MVLRELGYHLIVERQAWYIWDIVRHQLRERRVLFLHLDEAQDLSAHGTAGFFLCGRKEKLCCQKGRSDEVVGIVTFDFIKFFLRKKVNL